MDRGCPRGGLAPAGASTACPHGAVSDTRFRGHFHGWDVRLQQTRCPHPRPGRGTGVAFRRVRACDVPQAASSAVDRAHRLRNRSLAYPLSPQDARFLPGSERRGRHSIPGTYCCGGLLGGWREHFRGRSLRHRRDGTIRLRHPQPALQEDTLGISGADTAPIHRA